MPFIDTRVTMKLTDAQKDKLKTEYGKVISVIHKPESYLMCGFTDEYPLYFVGDKGITNSYQENYPVVVFMRSVYNCIKMSEGKKHLQNRLFQNIPAITPEIVPGKPLPERVSREWGRNGGSPTKGIDTCSY